MRTGHHTRTWTEPAPQGASAETILGCLRDPPPATLVHEHGDTANPRNKNKTKQEKKKKNQKGQKQGPHRERRVFCACPLIDQRRRAEITCRKAAILTLPYKNKIKLCYR